MKITSVSWNAERVKTIRLRSFWSFLLFAFLTTGCSTARNSDLSNFDLEDFKNHDAICSYSSQCLAIGYGISGSCNYDSNFNGYIIYSTTMGRKNILHLKNLVAQSREGNMKYLLPRNTSDFIEQLEECTPSQIIKPKLVCRERICRNRAYPMM